jgi:hypothetical protein
MGLKFNVKFLVVDVSLKTLRCMIDACAILYTSDVEWIQVRMAKGEIQIRANNSKSEALGFSR